MRSNSVQYITSTGRVAAETTIEPNDECQRMRFGSNLFATFVNAIYVLSVWFRAVGGCADVSCFVWLACVGTEGGRANNGIVAKLKSW